MPRSLCCRIMLISTSHEDGRWSVMCDIYGGARGLRCEEKGRRAEGAFAELKGYAAMHLKDSTVRTSSCGLISNGPACMEASLQSDNGLQDPQTARHSGDCIAEES